MDSTTEQKFISVVTEITFLASSTNWDLEILLFFLQLLDEKPREFKFYEKIRSHKRKIEFASISQLLFLIRRLSLERKLLSVIIRIIYLLSSMDLGSQPKPESELISLIKQIISLVNSKPDSESELVSLITQTMSLGISVDSDSEPTQESELVSLISQLVSLKPEPELTSLIRRIISRFRSLNWEPMQFISLCPQAVLNLDQQKLSPTPPTCGRECDFASLTFWRCERQIYFHCVDCNSRNHEEYDKAPVQAKHPLHPHHSLQLVYISEITRECYCCDENLRGVFYYCQACDYAMNFDCIEKPPPVLSIDHPKWHEHPLAPFPIQESLTCHLCAIHSRCVFYICPPCGFVVHQSCLRLPQVIRISRHPHRISFTPCFDQGDWFCSVCRRKIDSYHGGYSCIKDGCSYVAHSKCATQSNVWDGIDLEGVPEEAEEEELEPFVKISDGIIQHFSHQQHNLRLVVNTGNEYDENKLCQACITPIYFGNFYSCITCEFILHEECVNLSRKMHHPIHPHILTLVGGYDDVVNMLQDKCVACFLVCKSGFFYECGKEGCGHFILHVQCATISEPLVHGSHMHPLFLTSRPTEIRTCSVCEIRYRETFNCTEECDFSLCFRCASLPQRVRYKHDKHILHLTYGDETTEKNWCEACEKTIRPKQRFYKCDEYCCVTLHNECLVGRDLYMKPGSTCFYLGRKPNILANNQHMSRPICFYCKMRCQFPVVFKWDGKIFCCINCMMWYQK